MARAVYRTELQKVVNGVLTPAANATCTLYEAGTTDLLAATIYQDASSGSTYSNPLTADSDGTIMFFLAAPQAVKLVATATGLGTVTVDYQLVLVDQSLPIADPSFTGQVLLADGSASAPSLSNTGDTDTGLYFPGANQVALRAGNAVSMILDGGSVQRAYIFDTTGTRTVFQVNRGSGIANGQGVAPDSTYTPALAAQSFHDAVAGQTNEAIKGSAYASDGTGGFHLGVSGIAEAAATSGWTASGTHGLIGVFGQGLSHIVSARVWGANFIGKQQTAAGSALTGVEVGVEATVAVQDRYGVQIVTLADGTSAGSNEDVALKFANKNSTAGNRWADAVISFSSSDDTDGSGWPIQSGGTLIKAYAPVSVTAAYGIDFDGVSFGTAAIRSTGFLVNGSGRMGVRVAAVDGTAPLRVDCTGDTHVMVLDNISGVVQTTVGAAGAASALPANPTGYLLFKVGATEAAVPYYLKS